MNNTTLEMHDALVRTTDWLAETEMPVALVLTETLEPALGADAEIFPPTFAKDQNAKHPYNIDELRTDIAPSAAKDGETVNTCLIDSIGSQANRMETCFTKMPFSQLVPQITVVAKNQRANLLDIGHRIADAAIRFSELEAEAHSAIVSLEKNRSALDLAKLAPTSLVFGFWDSRETQFKFGRVLSSVVRANNVSVVSRRGQFKPAFDKTEIEWTDVDEKKLADIGLDDVPVPTNNAPGGVIRDSNGRILASHGGVRVFGKITRRTQINLVGLRALAVTGEDGEINEPETIKLRRYLFGLALIAARCQTSYNFREGCLLTRVAEESNVVYSDGNRPAFDWNLSASFDFANAAAQNFGVGENKPNVQFEVPKIRTKVEAAKKPKK